MLYVYDKENPTSFFKKFPNFKKIESSFFFYQVMVLILLVWNLVIQLRISL